MECKERLRKDIMIVHTYSDNLFFIILQIISDFGLKINAKFDLEM